MERIAQIAYFAGFFDGEGTVDIRHRKTHGGQYCRFELRVSVPQVVVSPLIELQANYGGSLCKPKKASTTNWVITGRQAIKFLSDVVPHLRVKKDEAEVGLAFGNLLLSFEYKHKESGRSFAKEPAHLTNMKVIYFNEIRHMRERKGFAPRNRYTLHAA